MNSTTDKRNDIIDSIPNYDFLLLHFPTDGYNGSYISLKGTYEQVVARLREWGAQRPDRGYNRRIFNGKLLAEGRDEEGFAFWVSAERPDPDLPDAWG